MIAAHETLAGNVCRYDPIPYSSPRPLLLLFWPVWRGGAAHAQTASYDDLRALRYYLQTGRRGMQPVPNCADLRAAHPDWRPPSDMNELLAPRAAAANG